MIPSTDTNTFLVLDFIALLVNFFDSGSHTIKIFTNVKKYFENPVIYSKIFIFSQNVTMNEHYFVYSLTCGETWKAGLMGWI